MPAGSHPRRAGRPAARRAAPVLAAALLAGPAAAADWDVTPRLRLQEILTDNVELRSAEKEGDLVTRLAPGLSIRGQGARLTVNADYNLENLVYAADGSRDQTNHQFQSNATVELWRDHLFVDASSRVSQQLIDNQGRFTNSNISSTGNRADTLTYTFAPYYRQHLGPWADLTLRYEKSKVKNDTNLAQDSDIESLSAELASGRRFTRVPWSVRVESREVDRVTGAKAEFDSLVVNTTYRFTRRYALDLTAGIEDNTFNTTQNNRDGTYWTVGGTWTPNRRTEASLAIGDRFFGTTIRGSARHQRRRLNLSIDYQEQPRTTAEDQAFLNIFPVVDDAGNPIFDPDLAGDFPLPIDGTALTQDVFVEKRLTGRATYNRRRDTVTFTVRDFAREFQTDRGDERTTSFSANWTRQLRRALTGGIDATWQRTTFDQGDREDRRIRVRPFLRYTLGPSVTGTLEYQFVDQSSDGSRIDFTENRLSASLNFHL